jgi:phosphatidylinositol dimannoside acyltransferase
MNAVELGYAVGWRLAGRLPRPVRMGGVRLAADLAYRRQGRGTRRLAANLRRVVGPDVPEREFAALVRQALRSYGRYWVEVFRLPSLSPEQVRANFHLGRHELLGADVAAKRGAIVALPHAGNWDAAGAWVAAMGWPLTTVAERLKPESVYELFLEFRQQLGMEIIPLTGGQQPPLDLLADRLRQGHVVPLLADRDLTARGVEVRFFGGRAKMPAGPALLAARTGAPLYVAAMWYERGGPRGRLDGPLPVPEGRHLMDRVRTLTQHIADHFAASIAQHPQDWHMLQRLWLDDVSGTSGAKAGTPQSRGNGTGTPEATAGGLQPAEPG